MGYTVDKKTGKIILVHDVTVSSKAVKQPETQQQRQQEQQTAATLPAIPAASMSSARASAPGTFVFPVTRQKVRTVWHEGNVCLWQRMLPSVWDSLTRNLQLLIIATMRKC